MTQPTFIGGSLLDDIDAEPSPTVAPALRAPMYLLASVADRIDSGGGP